MSSPIGPVASLSNSLSPSYRHRRPFTKSSRSTRIIWKPRMTRLIRCERHLTKHNSEIDSSPVRYRQETPFLTFSLDQLDTQQETIDHYKKELNCLESINKKETTHATCQTTIPIANVEAPRATNKRFVKLTRVQFLYLSSLTRVEKMLTMVVVLMAIIAGIEFERDVPLLLINCPGMGEALVGFVYFLILCYCPTSIV